MSAPRRALPAVGGYVLAGGQSSRMGRDKALLELAGRPLIAHAVNKLQRTCAQVAVVSGSPALGTFAPLVADVHPGCGPLGGMEAALLHTRFDWNLFLPVDVPFVPAALLQHWVRAVLPESAAQGALVLVCAVDGVPQPTLAFVHRELQPFLTDALEAGEYKLLPALRRAARQRAADAGLPPEAGYGELAVEAAELPDAEERRSGPEPWATLTSAQRAFRGQWFANLNTPGDFAEAAAHADALDRLDDLNAPAG